MALNEFSGGYYSLDMHVQPYEDGPVIDSAVYDYINREVYKGTNAPVTMKLSLDNGAYFNVGAENGVPPSVLAVPQSWIDNFDTGKAGKRHTIFVLKPGHSYLMHQSNIDKRKFRNTSLEDFTDE